MELKLSNPAERELVRARMDVENDMRTQIEMYAFTNVHCKICISRHDKSSWRLFYLQNCRWMKASCRISRFTEITGVTVYFAS